jgi:2-haloalkanoic acid dehalogenase type II
MDLKKLRLGNFKVLTFDCYGTLIDWETGIWDAFQPLLMANAGSQPSRRRMLEMFAVEENRHELEDADCPYPAILQRVHASVAEQLGLQSDVALDRAFGTSLPHWPAFADTADALRYLKKHYRLVVLSNVDRNGFAASNRKLGVEFDAVYTAEDIGSYKPDPRNFEYLADHLESEFGLRKGDILHTAQSLFHDHAPARSMGLATAWIDRQNLSESGDWGATASLDTIPKTDFLFHSLAELAAAVSADRRQE